MLMRLPPPGRPNSSGTQLKFKFHETASLIVTKVNDHYAPPLHFPSRN
jgi:hypothetical protein